MRIRSFKFWTAIALALSVAALLPLFQVVVVEPAFFRLVYEDGQPAQNIRVEQAWKEYSLEFWRQAEHVWPT